MVFKNLDKNRKQSALWILLYLHPSFRSIIKFCIKFNSCLFCFISLLINVSCTVSHPQYVLYIFQNWQLSVSYSFSKAVLACNICNHILVKISLRLTISNVYPVYPKHLYILYTYHELPECLRETGLVEFSFIRSGFVGSTFFINAVLIGM